MNSQEDIKNLLLKVAQQAGDMMSESFGLLQANEINYKKPDKKSPVTDVDINIDTMIREAVFQTFPDHDIISEEKESINNAGDVIWIIDPIDGTRNYINGIKEHCVSVGIAKGGEIILGAIYAPQLNEFFVAERGNGVLLNGEPLKKQTPNERLCYVDNKRLTTKSVKSVFKGCKETHNGSAALELAYVAQGKAEGSLLEHIMIWDIAAGMLMVEEMGGRLTTFDGSPYTFESSTLIAYSR